MSLLPLFPSVFSVFKPPNDLMASGSGDSVLKVLKAVPLPLQVWPLS